MASWASVVPGGDDRRSLVSHLLHGWLMMALGLVLVGAAIRDYRWLQVWGFLRVQFLVAEMVAGVGEERRGIVE
jgi:hypothetical protein